MNNKILITGASGFIGTNLLEYYLAQGNKVLNIDFQPPQNELHNKYWKNIDITNFGKLKLAVIEFSPDYIIHLAARTDLNGKKIEDYDANVLGVTNIIKVANLCSNLKRIIITSSMLVCKLGYLPKNEKDYMPDTMYGASKVQTELITRNSKLKCEWAIIRPTSIWGPWFNEPYRNFFDMIIAGNYFHIGNKSCTKTYGYIGNAIYQINSILFAETKKIKGKVFYIGDYSSYNIEKWGNEIATMLNRKIWKVPFFMIRIAALVGDLLKTVNVSFPMTSFRLKNMTTNNIVNLSNTQQIAPNLPFTRIEGIKETLKWLQKSNNKNVHK